MLYISLTCNNNIFRSLLAWHSGPWTGYGQTEQVNQELEQYLQLFINQRQDDWPELLPLAEFQYNNHIHSATQHQPFFPENGHLPRMGFQIGTLHCSERYGSRNNYSVVYSTGSWNSVNLRMSLCSARVRFRDSANVSPSSVGIPKRKPMCWFIDRHMGN